MKKTRAYEMVCYAAQVLGKDKPSWDEVLETIKKFSELGPQPLPPEQELREAYRDFRKVPRSRALGF